MNELARRRVMGGKSICEIGEITLTESVKKITLANPFGTTNVMVMIRQTDGINENIWATHGVFYFPYSGNNKPSTSLVHYASCSMESRNNWGYTSISNREGILSVTSTQIDFLPPTQFPFAPGIYQYVIVKL